MELKSRIMSVNKKNYKVVEVQYGYTTKFVVKKKVLWFFWKSIKNHSGFDMEYSSKRGAQAYINFLK
jgi:hypothetical protein